MSVIATPSSVQTASCGRVPLVAKFDCWPVSLPPMLTRSTSTPGTERISENGSREVGIFDSSSAVKFVAVPVCLPSTIGDGAATVIVSVNAADLHRHRQVDGLAEVQHDVLADVRREALERGGHLVGAGRQLEKAVSSLAVGRERLGDVDSLERHGHAGQRQAGGVEDAAGNGPRGGLGGAVPTRRTSAAMLAQTAFLNTINVSFKTVTDTRTRSVSQIGLVGY